MTPRRNALNLLAAHTTERDRAELAAQLHAEFNLPPETARRLVVAILSWMRTTSAPVRRFSRDPARLETRLQTIFDQLRAGASVKEIAQTLNLSAPRVSQILKQAALDGHEVPAFKRRRVRLDSVQMADVLDLLRAGYTYAEVQVKLDCTAQDVDRAAKALRDRGEAVPDRHVLAAWRLRLDALSKTFVDAKHEFERCEAVYASLGASQEEIETVKEECRRKTSEAHAALKAVKQDPPLGVISAPSLEHRLEAEKSREKPKVTIKAKPAAPQPAPAPMPANPISKPGTLGALLKQLEAKAAQPTTPTQE